MLPWSELFVDVDVDYDVEGGVPSVAGVTPYVEFTPRTFSCRACGLVLADRHLATANLAAAGRSTTSILRPSTAASRSTVTSSATTTPQHEEPQNRRQRYSGSGACRKNCRGYRHGCHDH